MPRKTNLPKRIINFLYQNPSATRKDISNALGVSYQAVQKHLRMMEKKRIVLTGFMVTSEWGKRYKKFWIFINTRYNNSIPGDEGEHESSNYQERLCKAIATKLTEENEFSRDISLDNIDILMGGDWDILLSVHTEDEKSVGHFVTRFLRTREDVVSTSTAWSLPIGWHHK